MMVNEINNNLQIDHRGVLPVLRYFTKAFHLSLSDIRPIEGSECFDRNAYTYEQFD